MSILKIKNSIVKLFLELLIINKQKRSILKAKWAKHNFKKYLVASTKQNNSKEEKEEKIIWQYWHQGEEKAPDIVKKCLNSIKRHYPDYQINVLSFNTISNYIELPQRFYWLLENKKISTAHFSDVLRLYLLSKYGGLWIDATMYATGKLSDEILEADFFMFQKNPKIDQMQNNSSCYLIKSKKHNIFLGSIKSSIEKYWSKNDFIINYFMFEHMVTLLSNLNKELIEEWEKMPCIYTKNVTAIQDKKFEKLDKADFDNILKETQIHKLTYKTIPENYKEENTYLSKLLES